MSEVGADRAETRTALARNSAYAAFFLFLVFFFGVRYGDYLRVVSAYSLFPPTVSELSFVFDPGGALEFLALLTASTFSLPPLGGSVLAALALAVARTAFLLWRLPDGKSLWFFCLSFLPGALASALFIGVGLNAFESTHGVFFLSQTYGVLLALLGALALRGFTSRTAVVLVYFWAYPLIGAHSFAMCAAHLLALWARAVGERKDRAPARSDVSAALLALAVCVAAPLFWNVSGRSLRAVCLAGLVEETTVSIAPPTLLRLNILMALLGAAILVGGAASAIACVLRDRKSNPAQTKKKGRRAKGSKGPADQAPAAKPKRLDDSAAVFAALVILALALWHTAPKDASFFATTGVAKHLRSGNWDGVLEAEARVPRPKDALISARFLALYKKGELGERLFERPVVSGEKLWFKIPPHRTFAGAVLEHWGFYNLAARTATNNYVATRGRSIPATKTLAVCALANGDEALARRYLLRLERSISTRGRDWSAELRSQVDATAPILTGEDYIATRIDYVDEIVADGLALRADFVESGGADELNVWEARLAFALLRGDFETFSSELEPYWTASGKGALPRAFQESALFLERLNQLDASNFGIEQALRDRFSEFVKYVELYDKTRDQALLEGMSAEFGDTAWFYFLFVSGTGGDL